MDATLGRLNDLFLGVEQDGSSTYHRVEILLKNKYMSGFLDDSSISTSITFEKKKRKGKGSLTKCVNTRVVKMRMSI